MDKEQCAQVHEGYRQGCHGIMAGVGPLMPHSIPLARLPSPSTSEACLGMLRLGLGGGKGGESVSDQRSRATVAGTSRVGNGHPSFLWFSE